MVTTSPISTRSHEVYVAPSAPPDIWTGSSQTKTHGSDIAVHYVVRSPWKWIMERVAKDAALVGGMTEVPKASDLPTAKQAAKLGSSPPLANGSRRNRRRQNFRIKSVIPSTLKIEISHPGTGAIDLAVHGTSSALDGLEDKDELVRTIQRCRCDHLQLSPPSILISWDVTYEECCNVVGKDLPALSGAEGTEFAVLKEPMGSQGSGIYFVRTAKEIHKTIQEHRKRALDEPQFLDNLIAEKGRIPSWVLQAEVFPCLLVRGGRKFHIRSYLVVVEKVHHPDLFDMFIFNRHEVRIAGMPVPKNGQNGSNGNPRDRKAHITNGALSSTTERVLLDDVPELKNRGLDQKVQTFVAEAFGKRIVSDIGRRVGLSVNHQDGGAANIRKFAVAGLDLMVTEDNRIYLLEVNSNPAAPPENTVSPTFRDHLTGFMHDLCDLVLGSPNPNFVSVFDVLEKNGLSG